MVPCSVQYSRIMGGSNLWDLLHDYKANSLIKSEVWNHMKLVVSNEQMKCCLNGETVLWMPELLGPSKDGSISLEENGIYANMNIDKGNIQDVLRLK